MADLEGIGGQVPQDDKLYRAEDSADSADEFSSYISPSRKAASADLVKGRMFDVLFQGKNEELSAAKLRDKMQQIITQASIEDNKVRPASKVPPAKRKHAWKPSTRKQSQTEDPDKITLSRIEPFDAAAFNSKRHAPYSWQNSSLIKELHASTAESEAKSEDDGCSLAIKHRHETSIYDSPDCSADMHEFKISVILITFMTVSLNLLMTILCFQYGDHLWQLSLVLQLISGVFHPLIELMLSARVRFYFKDCINTLSGDHVAKDTVIVT